MAGATPVGEWELDLSTGTPADDQRLTKLFADDRIVDMVLQVSFKGTTPPWPA